MVIRLLSVGVVITAVLMAGCGSSGGTEASETETTASATTVGGVSLNTGLDRLPPVTSATSSTRPPASSGQAGDDGFIREVFADAQAMWRSDFGDGDVQYVPARLVIFTDHVRSACGTRGASTGPFYCAADHGVYLNVAFFETLAKRAGTTLGDFAQAYVVAHELGHHVQFLLGITQRVKGADTRDPTGQNERSIRFELQADCLSGVWMHSRYQRDQLTQADVDDALRAAAIAGNDFQQLSTSGTVRPETWSHGSSSQRRRWLTIGLEGGAPAACDTFSGRSP